MANKHHCACGYKTHTYEESDDRKKRCSACKRIYDRNKQNTDDEYIRQMRLIINPRRG